MLYCSYLFSLTNGSDDLFTVSSDSTTNTFIIQYSLIRSNGQLLQQTATISNVLLGDDRFHHIAVAVHDTWLTVILDGVVRLRRELTSSVATEADNIYVGTLNELEQPTFEGMSMCCKFLDGHLSTNILGLYG